MVALLKRYLRLVDRKVLLLMLSALVGLVCIDRIWVSGVNDRLAAQAQAREEADRALKDLMLSITELYSDGVRDAASLKDRVARMETVLPKGDDSLTTTRLVIAIAQSSGVTLDKIKASDNSTKWDTVGVLKGYRFEITVSGPYAAIRSFLNSMTSSDGFIATYDSLQVTPASTSDLPSLLGGNVTITGEVTVWRLREDPVAGVGTQTTIAPTDQPAPSTTIPDTQPGTPTTISTSTDTPTTTATTGASDAPPVPESSTTLP